MSNLISLKLVGAFSLYLLYFGLFEKTFSTNKQVFSHKTSILSTFRVRKLIMASRFFFNMTSSQWHGKLFKGEKNLVEIEDFNLNLWIFQGICNKIDERWII